MTDRTDDLWAAAADVLGGVRGDTVDRHAVAQLDELTAQLDTSVGAAAGQLIDTVVCQPKPLGALRTLFASQLGQHVLPEIAALAPDALQAGDGTRTRHKDNLDHSLRVCAQAPPRRRVRWGALLHDIGKAPTRKIIDGQITFRHHETVGAKLCRQRFSWYGWDSDFTSDVAALIETSGRSHGWADAGWEDAAVRRFARELGGLLDDALDLARADCTSGRPGRRQQVIREVNRLEQRIADLAAADAEAARRPALNGDEIAALLNITPGPQLGQAWRWLRDWTVEHPDADHAAAVAALRDWWNNHQQA